MPDPSNSLRHPKSLLRLNLPNPPPRRISNKQRCKIRILTRGQNPVFIVYSKDRKGKFRISKYFSTCMARSMPLARVMYLLLAIHLAWTLGRFRSSPARTRTRFGGGMAGADPAASVAGTLLYVLAGYRPHFPAARNAAHVTATIWDRSSHGAAAPASQRNSVVNCFTTATTLSRR